jgi:hypothetical protein
MSLINDALKKAQRQRSTDSATPLAPMTASNPPVGKVTKRAKPLAFQSQVVRMAATVLGIGLLLIGGVLYWQWKSFASESLTLGSAKVPTKTAPKVAATSPAPAETEPVKENSPATAAPVFSVPNPVPSAAAAEVRESPPAVVPAAPTIKARADPKILAYVDTLRVTGIRAAGGDSKVLMNDRVFRVNDIVDHALGLKLTGVSANALTFEDERGVVYSRNF